VIGAKSIPVIELLYNGNVLKHEISIVQVFLQNLFHFQNPVFDRFQKDFAFKYSVLPFLGLIEDVMTNIHHLGLELPVNIS
jgi:hypothetical protein